MKRFLAAMALVLLFVLVYALTCPVRAEDPVTNFLAYFPNYHVVPSTQLNSGATGLVTGQCYAAFLLTDLPLLVEANLATNSDVRKFMFTFNDVFLDAYEAIVATNRPDTMTASRRVGTAATNDAAVTHEYRTEINWTSTGISIGAEIP